MQSLNWYVRRLQSMSPAEISWRALSEIRNITDRYRFKFGLYPSFEEILSGNYSRGEEPGFRVSDISQGGLNDSERKSEWYKELIYKAERIAEHKLTLFDLNELDLGNPINWNYDHGNKKKVPLSYAQSIDYRDFEVTGDCKYVWEPARHHQLVVLGRAYRASGDIKYASAVVEQIDSWLVQCPFGYGMQWRSPLELGIRLINWVWALDLIRESGLVSGDFRKRILHSVYLHLWEITRKYSKGSSANNHLIGEAAGVFIASSYFPELKNSKTWVDESRAILSQEIFSQTYTDGCSREQALGYHFFILQFFLFSGIVGRWTGNDFHDDYWKRIEKMLEFAAAVTEGGDDLPMFGDCDDGYVLDLGGSHKDARLLLAVGSEIFERSDFRGLGSNASEPVLWLLGTSAYKKYKDISQTNENGKLSSCAFKDSGYYLLQWGKHGDVDRVSVMFDCGELGYKSIAAHGHADSLSFSLRAYGIDIFVDPGTFDYFTYPELRNYFRSTRAHNTAEIDGIDQSEMLGPFLWGERAISKCIQWEPGETRAVVVGEHDGYRRLSDPVLHRRTLKLDSNSRSLMIEDNIICGKEHSISIYFHLSEHCSLTKMQSNLFKIATKVGEITLEIDPRLSTEIISGSENPISGWTSRGYHQKVSSATLVAKCISSGSSLLSSKVTIGEPIKQ